MPHPAGLPDLFIDRSLGRYQVPAILRAAGLRLVTLAEHYGVPRDESVTDVEWLADIGSLGWAVLMKDERIRYRPAERAAVASYKVRCFCLTQGNIQASVMADYFLNNLRAIEKACHDEGPFVYAVHARQIVRML